MFISIRDLKNTQVINPTFEVDEKSIKKAQTWIENNQSSVNIPASRLYFWALAVQLAFDRVFPRA